MKDRSMKRREFLRRAALAAVPGITPTGRAAAIRRSGNRVVIVGGGFGGSACALHLRNLEPEIHVTLIDPDEPYITCPMSSEVLIAARDLASLTVTRSGLRRAGVQVIRDRVTGVDAGAHRVRLDRNGTLGFDRLVLAPGIRFLTERIDGYDEHTAEKMPHAWRAGEQTRRLAAQLGEMRDGGVVAISVPAGLYRCPPGPYERASLIAGHLARNKPRAKVLIFDSNNQFPKQDLFTAAWAELYPGMIEWISSTEGGAVVRVEPGTMTLHTSSGEHRVDVANVIPPQAPGQLAADAGLASGHGWCPIEPLTFQSTINSGVHVIGDACIAGDMPKSGSAAVSQARQCAKAIVALLAGRDVPVPALDSICYSILSPDRGIRIPRRYELREGRIEFIGSSTDAGSRAGEAEIPADAERWYRQIRREAFGG
jgi:sulfide dehydrogenase [flavocytochrome c] flavoprotein subunit